MCTLSPLTIPPRLPDSACDQASAPGRPCGCPSSSHRPQEHPPIHVASRTRLPGFPAGRVRGVEGRQAPRFRQGRKQKDLVRVKHLSVETITFGMCRSMTKRTIKICLSPFYKYHPDHSLRRKQGYRRSSSSHGLKYNFSIFRHKLERAIRFPHTALQCPPHEAA